MLQWIINHLYIIRQVEETYHRVTLGTPSILTPLPSLSDEFFTIHWTKETYTGIRGSRTVDVLRHNPLGKHVRAKVALQNMKPSPLRKLT